MATDFKLFKAAPQDIIEKYLGDNPTTIVLEQKQLERELQYRLVQYDVSLDHNAQALNFLTIEGLNSQSTLFEVYEKLKNTRSGAVFIYDSKKEDVVGVITWNILQNFLQRAQY